MRIKLNGYQITKQLYESSKSLVYRGVKEQSNLPVILKFLKQEYPSREELIRYKQEYEITKNLKIKNAIAAYDFKRYQNTFAIIFEDFGGSSLDILIKKHSLTVKEFLDIAIKITIGLKAIHQANIIHKDINPANIVYNPITKELKIIDFGMATILPKENTKLQNLNILEGTLAYISPEQTGRINRPLDYRTDFYSLGITFYELLTNRRPFFKEDLLELLYSHLAEKPLSPHQYSAKNPSILSDIIMKLIEKNPDDRYQSNWGLQKDLENCWQQLKEKGEINNFQLATQDIYDKFQISQKLYGREKEVESLLKKFKQVSNQENHPSQVMLISGYSGIGKSRLVGEIYRPITEAKGYFIKGKFEQYQRNIPYMAFRQAWEELIDYLLVEPEDALKQWREKILKLLGDNAQIIIDVIPKLELILGQQPKAPSLPAQQTVNLFNLLWQKFLKVFCQKEHPLTIFLDDLQWIDSASLSLMQLIVTSSDIEYLFLIGAYRDNEVNSVHPLMLAIDEIEKAGTLVERISLSPLELSHLTDLITDSLRCERDRAKPLAELLLAKTEGNPFFTNKFLYSLYKDNLLYFDYKDKIWQWDLEEIKAKNITDNVVELLSLEIKKLNSETQQILQLAACMGNQFEITTLAIVAEYEIQKTALLLREALEIGLVYPLSNAYKSIELEVSHNENQGKIEYKFVHDRIQEAAYSLIPEPKKTSIHLQIGRLLLKSTNLKEQEEKIFDIVNHLNIGRDLIIKETHCYELAHLNLIAGQKARDSSAFSTALNYFNIGLKLLASNSWQSEYDLTLTLHTKTAEAAYLSGQFEQQFEFSELILKRANSLLDRVKAYEIKILASIAQARPVDAVHIALKVLRLLGFNFPNKPSKLRILLALVTNKLTLIGKNPEDLINIGIMNEPNKLAALEIIGIVGSATYNSVPELVPLLAIKAVNLSVKYGNSPMSAYGYVSYAVILCGGLGDIENGYRFGLLGLNLLEKLKAKELKARILMVFNNFIRHWKEHIREGLKPLLETYAFGIESGDLEFAAYCVYIYCYHSYFIGVELPELCERMTDYINLTERLRQVTAFNLLKIYRQVILNLLQETPSYSQLIGESFDEKVMLPQFIKTNHQSSIFHLYCNKLILCYLFEQFSEALKNSATAQKYLDSVRSTLLIPVFYFYYSLSQLAIWTEGKKSEQQEILKIVNANQKKMKKWAHYAPMNYLHKYYLVEAEKYRILGQKFQAAENYDLAIALAKENEFIQEEALANELAGKFYWAEKKDKLFEVYLKEAYFCYQKWGAQSKVKALEERYPQIFYREESKMTEKVKFTQTSGSTSNKITSEDIDLATLIKTSQALSQETKLETLLDILLKFTIENIGAQTGLIILNEDDNNLVEAVIKSETAIEKSEGKDSSIICSNINLQNSDHFPISLITYVQRTREAVILSQACSEGIFIKDDYIIKHQIKSILSLPLLGQGQLIGVIYLENNLTVGAFNAERLEILKLISSQAAIALENALLRNKQSEPLYQYQVGGCLTPNSPSYVIRQADRDLYNALKKGDFCYVLNARQMGKSSLRVQISNKLTTEGFACATVDLTAIGYENITLEEWYFGLIDELLYQFQLDQKFDCETWWENLEKFSPVQKFSKFIKQILPQEIKEKIVIFIDEIDCVSSLNFNTDDFFALIRSLYNQRADFPTYQRVTFVLLGVATPSSLIQNKDRTPFNIGCAIPLSGFELHEIQPLEKGLAQKYTAPQTLLKAVLTWTGGQPFLTQKLCNLILKSSTKITEGKEIEFIEKLVLEKIVENWEFQDEPQHLRTIRDRLLNKQSFSRQLLELYQQILQQEEIDANGSQETTELLLSGLVCQQQGKLKVHNPIYQAVFNRNWIAQTLKNIG
ncbi:MAG: AAA family ATPase [Prochloraceae cyanobacterium]|nr:AAA family ATPase [Prochloraceae cyanobacterium]